MTTRQRVQLAYVSTAHIRIGKEAYQPGDLIPEDAPRPWLLVKVGKAVAIQAPGTEIEEYEYEEPVKLKSRKNHEDDAPEEPELSDDGDSPESDDGADEGSSDDDSDGSEDDGDEGGFTREELEQLTVPELHDLAEELGVEVSSDMRKADIVDALSPS